MPTPSAIPLTVFLDPNYHPVFSYSHLEGWLLLYDQIFISSPSPHQVTKASGAHGMPVVREDTVERLVREGWLVPVGRPRFFSEDWRRDRARELEIIDPVRSAHFSWSGKFDTVMAKHARLLDDAQLDQAIASGQSLDQRHPDVFDVLRKKVTLLKADGGLPAKFAAPSESNRDLDDTVRGVIYEVSGDIWVRRTLQLSGLVVPPGQEGIYGLLDQATESNGSALAPRIGAAPTIGDGIGVEDVKLAQELTGRIASNYSISDVIGEFRKSQLQHELRAWIVAIMNGLRTRVDPRSYGHHLWHLFEDQADHIGANHDVAAWLSGIGVATASLHPAVSRLMSAGITRRALLTVAVLQLANVAGRPLFGPALDAIESGVRREHDRWIAFITVNAPRRS